MNDSVNRLMGEDILQNYDVTNLLHRLNDIPSIVAQGIHDILPPAKIEKLLIKHIPHAKLHKIQNCTLDYGGKAG